ncbi:hypothetical protein GGI07_001157 [Coemansia sp. Benny D115]|nr:hypothetical protein GGI07_001157 [Coemansia sp. Benny D115]
MTQSAVDKREVAVVGVNTTLISISFIALVYVNINRSYVPLKCKNIPLLNILFLTMFFWYLGDIYTYQPSLVTVSRPVCIATMSWLRMSLGVYSVISCHIFRIYQYLCIFEWKVKASGWYLWSAVCLWLVVPLVYGVFATALPESRGTSYVAEPPMCLAHKPAYFAAVALLVLLMVCWIWATVLMRRVHVCFNEYRELLVVIVSTVIVILMQVVLRWVPGVGDSGFAFNTMASVSDVCIAQVGFFVLISRPAYHCLVDREEYLRRFLHTLRRENRQAEYEMANGEQMVRLSSSSAGNDARDSECRGPTADFNSTTESTRSLARKLFLGSNDDSVTAFHGDLEMCATPKRLVEAVVASELTASGQKVLHVDRNPYYGGSTACFSMAGFFDWVTHHRDVRQTPRVELTLCSATQQASFSIDVVGERGSLADAETSAEAVLERLQPYISGSEDAHECLREVLDQLLASSRAYGVELAPKVTLCRGDTIDLLVNQGVGEYVQFKGVEHNYIVRGNAVERVPESKEDVFSSTTLSLIEKRKLMRLLTAVRDDQECTRLLEEAGDGADFSEFVKAKFKLGGRLLDAVVYAVARQQESPSGVLAAREGLERVHKYVKAMGRFGKMAYLCAMYGGGSEIAQAFCRLCAVSGGIYMLGEGVEIERCAGGGCSVRLESHGTVQAKRVVMDACYLREEAPAGQAEIEPEPEPETKKQGVCVVSRAFCVLDRPVLGEDTTALLSQAPTPESSGSDGAQAVSLLYMTQATNAAPAGQCVLYAWAAGELTPARRDRLYQAIRNIASFSQLGIAPQSAARPLLTAYYETRDIRGTVPDASVVVAGGPDSEAGFDSAVRQAQRILSENFGLTT